MENPRATKRTYGILALVAVVALLGVGIASAHAGSFGPFGGRGYAKSQRVAETCDDNITVGECRALMGDPCNDAMTVAECRAAWAAKHDERRAARYAACVEKHGEAFCDNLPARFGHHAHGHGHGHGQGHGHARAQNATAEE